MLDPLMSFSLKESKVESVEKDKLVPLGKHETSVKGGWT